MELAIKTERIGAATVQTVNARELHDRLKVGKDFSTWVKAQIKRADLTENTDYVKVPQKGELSATGQTIVEYHLTIEAGKNIAMLSGTEKGKEVRAYFIECERKANSQQKVMTSAEMLLAIAQQNVDAERRVTVVESRVLAIEDKITARERNQTALEFSISLGLATDKSDLRDLGVKASKISRAKGLEITTKHQDQKGFRGNVNAYHPDALFAAIEEMETA